MDYLSKYIKYKNKYIQTKYKLLIGGTNYSKQLKLEEEGEIPEIKFNGEDIRTVVNIKMYISSRNSLFWTDDNEESIKKYYNPKKIICNITDLKDISDEDYSKNYYLFNCSKFRRGYKINFDSKDNLDCFIKKNVKLNIETPTFNEFTPYSFIFYVKILEKNFNAFNTFFSYYLQFEICNSIILWCDNLIKTKYKKKQNFFYFIENDIDRDNRFSQIILETQSSDDVNNDIKLQMCIKDEYLFWVVENLCKNFDKLYSLGLLNFKFFTPSNNKYKKHFDYFPDHTKDERLDSYSFEGKEYKRELLTSPTIVFYLTKYKDQLNMNKLINELKCLFPDHLDITNGFPRFNIRLTKNIFFSVGGNNNKKFTKSLIKKKYIPSEYKYILDKYDKVDINECKRLNEYSKNLTDHDILILNEGKYIPNNITSYYMLIKGDSFKHTFKSYELDKFYVCPP
jgi:hypothetical protein